MMTVAPERMTAGRPRTLSTLTARVMNGTRYLLQALAVPIALMLAVVAARTDFDRSRSTSWLFIGGPLRILGLVAFAYRNEAGTDA
ncbi:hypothetical protein [Halosolutus gelatinilyticus]|uniref:hypothetical protein n=1 Tax=Halosolutus gelatinilyticus TaxID=2931975 RepID=UPI001FF2EB5A|nr:hypothetical protein [Halosolutus gelatinilyticus]